MPDPIFSEAGSSSRSRRMSQNVTTTGRSGNTIFTGQIAIQITGVATAVTAIVQRSTKNPGLDGLAGNWATVDTLTGNPSANGIVSGYYEPASSWYSINITSLTGASVDVDISGGRG